jgi:hypothetical protein
MAIACVDWSTICLFLPIFERAAADQKSTREFNLSLLIAPRARLRSAHRFDEMSAPSDREAGLSNPRCNL